MTSQRLGIYRYLIQTDSHPTADEIFQALKEQFPAMSPATVYKTLELLEEMNLVTVLGFDGAASRYDGNPDVHVNLVCGTCGKIADIEEPLLEELKERVRDRAQFQVFGQRHELYGLCPACQTERAPSLSK